MLPSRLLSLLAIAVVANARPEFRRQTNSTLSGEVVTSIVSATLTVDFTSTLTATLYPSGQQAPPTPESAPTSYQTYVISAVSPGTEIDLLPLQAIGLAFFLGGYPASYCPSFVEEMGGICPPGNITGINGCSLSTMVPGGQYVYLAPDGSLRYSQAHSAMAPMGATPCPLRQHETNSTGLWEVTAAAPGGNSGLMACPTLTDPTNSRWMVFAAVKNASVPLGNVSACIPFEAIAYQVSLGNVSAATWQYI